MTREEAIKIIDNLHLIGCGRNQHEDDLKINVALDMAIEALKDRPQGEWIKYESPMDYDDGKDAWDCSLCGAMVGKRMDFCPNCGADMRGER